MHPVHVHTRVHPSCAWHVHGTCMHRSRGSTRTSSRGPRATSTTCVHMHMCIHAWGACSVPALVTQRLELGHKGLPERTVAPEGELARQRLDAAQGAEDVRVARPRPPDEHAPPRLRHLQGIVGRGEGKGSWEGSVCSGRCRGGRARRAAARRAPAGRRGSARAACPSGRRASLGR